MAGFRAADGASLIRPAVLDASAAGPDEISHDLLTISPADPNLQWRADKQKVLVATWKSPAAYEQYIKNGTKTSDNERFVVWVSAVPGPPRSGLDGVPTQSVGTVKLWQDHRCCTSSTRNSVL